jgi:hypothetical protein
VPDPAQAPNSVKRSEHGAGPCTTWACAQYPDFTRSIDKVFIGSCTNSRIEDLRAAAAVVQGRRRVAANVKQALVVPGSGLVKRQAEAEGLDRIFVEAGFEWREPGLFHVPGHERRPPATRRALRLHLQPQLRRAARDRAGAPIWSVRLWLLPRPCAGRFVDVRQSCRTREVTR